MHHILFDSATQRADLLPFTHTRPVADIRCGILTMRERWERYLGTSTGTLTEAYLQELYPANGHKGMFINGSVFATAALVQAIKELGPGQALVKGDVVIAAHTIEMVTYAALEIYVEDEMEHLAYDGEIMQVRNIWDIFSLNDKAIAADFALLTAGRKSAPTPAGVTVTGDKLFIEEGANIYAGCIINATTGPVYIGKDAEILEGTLIRGPLAVCEHGVLKMGAKVYGATTIGPGSKAGGEINNAVFFANSNKAHDGYLGNAVIGEWCNLGADTNCSNLKNNYDVVKVRHEASGKDISTGLIFCGLMMGDHSKCGINTMFNTGTVVGPACNIYGGGFPDKYIPSFSWGGSDGFVPHTFDKAMATAERVYARRSKKMSSAERTMYQYIYDNR
ncbi:GlmU family protein [Nemorincola caseinilytica]|uniref:GlmU family protein n=1 Tax=Nemorincola caseinilytica TaxID=2054315 RepID=A0ABP8NKH4_9BACT